MDEDQDSDPEQDPVPSTTPDLDLQQGGKQRDILFFDA
jgi:hypothetical protein